VSSEFNKLCLDVVLIVDRNNSVPLVVGQQIYILSPPCRFVASTRTVRIEVLCKICPKSVIGCLEIWVPPHLGNALSRRRNPTFPTEPVRPVLAVEPERVYKESVDGKFYYCLEPGMCRTSIHSLFALIYSRVSVIPQY
jgi:hypothetical protein